MNTTHTIEIEQTNNHFVATVPEIGVTVTGATEDEALVEAQRAIMRAMMEEAKKEKQKRGKGRTVA